MDVRKAFCALQVGDVTDTGPLGIDLEPGHVIMPGSMTRAYPVKPGDTVFAGMGKLGGVTAVFGN